MGYEELVGAASDEPRPVVGGGSDPLFIMYTSGTTGLPKGAVHSHDTVEWAILTVLASVDMRYRDRYLISMPLFHVGALNPLTCIVYLGATAVLMRQFDATEVWTVLRDERVTNTLAVPTMLNAMLSTLPAVEERPPALRWFMSGATPVPTSLIETYTELGFEILQVYGLTETCGPACVIGPDDAITHIGSTGKAFFHTDIRLVDHDGNDVDVDQPGEVLVSGRHVMVGYWNRPDDTAATIRDGWLSTGDVAVRDADGFIFIRDRIKDMIITGGENVYPAEIEDLLLTHPDVADAAVITMPSARWGESPLAVIVTTRRRPRRASRPRPLRRPPRPLQATTPSRLHRHHSSQPHRQDPQAAPSRPVRVRRTGMNTSASVSGLVPPRLRDRIEDPYLCPAPQRMTGDDRRPLNARRTPRPAGGVRAEPVRRDHGTRDRRRARDGQGHGLGLRPLRRQRRHRQQRARRAQGSRRGDRGTGRRMSPGRRQHP